MKHTFKLLCFGLLFIGNGLFAQEEEKKAKKSPVELMFEDYNEEFKPLIRRSGMWA